MKYTQKKFTAFIFKLLGHKHISPDTGTPALVTGDGVETRIIYPRVLCSPTLIRITIPWKKPRGPLMDYLTATSNLREYKEGREDATKEIIEIIKYPYESNVTWEEADLIGRVKCSIVDRIKERL